MTMGTDTPRRSRAIAWLATGVVLVHVWLLTRWLEPPIPTASPATTVTLAPATAIPAQTTVAPAAQTEAPATAAAPAQTHAAQPPKAISAVTSNASSAAPTRAAASKPPTAPASEQKKPPALDSIENTAIVEASHSTQNIAQAQAPSLPEDKPQTAAQPVSATAPGRLKMPSAAELQYDVRATRKGMSLPAQSVLRWQPAAGSYQARMEFKALFVGARSQTSVGTLSAADGLMPTRYGDKNRSEQATHFDRTRQPPVLRFSANTPDLPLQPHTQDRLSVLLQLGAMLAGEPARFGPGQTVTLHTAGPKDADLWQFRVGNTTALNLPAGTLEAVHLDRAPLHTYDNRVEVWLAPSLGYLPVRILWTQANGDVVDQQLARHSSLPLIP